jgi:hypothetical protein
MDVADGTLDWYAPAPTPGEVIRRLGSQDKVSMRRPENEGRSHERPGRNPPSPDPRADLARGRAAGGGDRRRDRSVGLHEDEVQVTTRVSDAAISNAQADAYVNSLEAAAVLPSTAAASWNSQADAYVDSLEAAAVLPSTAAAIWNAQADAYVDSLVAAAGGGPKAGGHRPIEVNGEICGQCR